MGPKKKETGLVVEGRANLCLGLMVVSTCLLIDSAPGQCQSGEEVEDVEANRCYSGENPGGRFGSTVAGLGDIIGPCRFITACRDEAIIGENGDDDGPAKVYVVHRTNLNPYYYEIDVEDQPNFFSRPAVAPAGDVDNDGTTDFIVGGHVTRVYSGRTGAVVASFIGENPGDQFGQAVAGIGDIDGNGFDDIAVGAPLNTAGTGDFSGLFPQAGRVYVFLTRPLGQFGHRPAAAADIIFTGNAGDWVGFDIASGDVNGDDVPDLIMGAIYARPANEQFPFGGKVYIYFACPDLATPVEFGAGDDPLDDDVNVIISQTVQNEFFGWSVAAGGDFDNDGRDDVAVGFYKGRDLGMDTGKTYIFSSADLWRGGPSCDPAPVFVDSETAAVKLAGRQDAPISQGGGEGSISFGWDVAFVGDVNGNGHDDILIGAPYYDEGIDPDIPLLPLLVDSGEAYLFHGFAGTFTGTSEDADITYAGTMEGAELGYAVGGHGRANLSAFPDLIIGAPGYDQGAGRAFVFFSCRDHASGQPCGRPLPEIQEQE